MTKAVPTRVIVETGSRRTFASAADWPGWCRSGRDPEGALAALIVYAPRYQIVAREAGAAFDLDRVPGLAVIETVAGNATTEFGAPGMVAGEDRMPIGGKAMSRMLALVGAAWVVFDQVVATAPAELRKGPRGGGRDRDQIVDHVLEAEMAYLHKLGLKQKAPAPSDGKSLAAVRDETLRRMGEGGSGEPLAERGWPVRYAARRIAWHILDHAWEIEDRS